MNRRLGPPARPSTARAASGSGADQLRSLLVPLDLTPSSDRVLGRLALLPLAPDARIALLHVVPGSLPYGEQRRAARDASKALASEVRHLRKQLPRQASIEALVQSGAPAKVIAESAAELQAELIVMGRGSSRTLRDSLVGSTAERVLRQARIPVLVARLAPRATYYRPALALDLDEAAHEVVRMMLRVLPPPRPRIEVIHAFDDPYQGFVYPSLSEQDAEDREDDLRTEATRQVNAAIIAALAKAKVPPEDAPSWKTRVHYGSPRYIVEKAIRKSESDLLVLGTRGHAGAAYVFLGTVAGDLLRAAKCDVLVIPPTPKKK